MRGTTGTGAPPARDGEPRIFLFGLSGATWSVMRPMMEAGRLPWMRALAEEGAQATLRSIRAEGDKHYRPQTAWAAAATGCRPEKAGITRYFHSADDLRVPPLWRLLHQAGLAVGVYGWPLDWPPEPVNGFIVPSPWARDSRTWPPDLAPIKALDREHQDGERGGFSLAARRRQIAAAVAVARLAAPDPRPLAPPLAQWIRTRDPELRANLLRHLKAELGAQIFVALLRRRRPRFASFHSFLVDFTSHRFWRHFEPGKFSADSAPADPALADVVPAAYERADAVLGRILRALPSGAAVLVMSEHGMSPETEPAEVGPWRYVIDGPRLADRLGVADAVIARPVARWIAYRPRSGDRLPPELADRFRSVLVEETGLPLFDVNRHGEDEVVVKFRIDRGVERYRRGPLETLTLRIGGRAVPFAEVTRRLGRARSAMHDRDGVLILRGGGFRGGATLPDVDILDIAPTLLAWAGLPVPAHMDGAPLRGAEVVR